MGSDKMISPYQQVTELAYTAYSAAINRESGERYAEALGDIYAIAQKNPYDAFIQKIAPFVAEIKDDPVQQHLNAMASGKPLGADSYIEDRDTRRYLFEILQVSARHAYELAGVPFLGSIQEEIASSSICGGGPVSSADPIAILQQLELIAKSKRLKEIGVLIREARQQQGMTQNQLVERAVVKTSQSALNKIETGRYASPWALTFIGDALGITDQLQPLVDFEITPELIAAAPNRTEHKQLLLEAKNKRLKEVGVLIREARQQQGMTQNQLMEKTGLSLSSISNVENGQEPYLLQNKVNNDRCTSPWALILIGDALGITDQLQPLVDFEITPELIAAIRAASVQKDSFLEAKNKRLKEVGVLIREARQQQGMTQNQLVERVVGISQPALNKIETGRYASPWALILTGDTLGIIDQLQPLVDFEITPELIAVAKTRTKKH